MEIKTINLTFVFFEIESIKRVPKTDAEKTTIARNLHGNWKFCKIIILLQIKSEIGSIKNIETNVYNKSRTDNMYFSLIFLNFNIVKGENKIANH